MNNTTFIYALTCPDTGEVRYIGKANNPQLRLKSHISRDNNKRSERSHKSNWIKSLMESGKYPSMIILEEVALSNWIEAEKKWIAHYRLNGAKLTNITDGGQGGFTRNGTDFQFGKDKNLVRFTIDLSDDLLEWVDCKAKKSNVSRNKFINDILVQQFRDTDKPRFILNHSGLCHNGTHCYKSNEPGTADFCNCGMYVLGELRQ